MTQICLTKDEETARSAKRHGLNLLASIRHPATHLALLTVLTLICFGRSLGTYFLADDFGEIHYVHRIFHGEPWLFWMNFTGNYMQIDGMSVLRPFLLLSLVLDYLVWRGNAFGYYLTNLAAYTGCVLMLYLLCRKLTREWPEWRSISAATAAAALFAVNPLHAESVSWVVGRVDILCAFFYLIGLTAFLTGLESKRKMLWSSITVASFWSALFVKEMAIGLPVVACLLALFRAPDGSSVKDRVLLALSNTACLWVSTIIYFGLRFLTLGTLTGGYVAGFGASQEAQMLARWLDADSWQRILVPLNQAVFQGATGSTATIFCTIYTVFFALFAVSLLQNRIPWRLLFIGVVWGATTLLPIYKLFGIGYNLEGARFVYFFTMPLAFLFSVLLLAPQKERESKDSLAVSIAAILVLGSMISCFAKVAIKTNREWVHAGKEVRAVLNSASQIAGSRSDKLILLGLPKEKAGAHMILNGQTLEAMLNPPFSNETRHGRFITFDPIMYGPAEQINASRFKRTFSWLGADSVLIWNSTNRKFEKITFSGESTTPLPPEKSANGWQPHTLGQASSRTIEDGWLITNASDKDGLLLKDINLNPLDVDFIEFQLRSSTTSPMPLRVFCNVSEGTGDQASLVGKTVTMTAAKWQVVRMPLSSRWRWYQDGTIKNIFIELPAGKRNVEIRRIRFLSARGLVPEIEVVDHRQSSMGVYFLPRNAPLTIRCSTADFKRAKRIRLSLSKPNYFFDNFSDHFSDAVDTELVIERTSDDQMIVVDPERLKGRGFRQVVAACLDEEGGPTGERSDPLTIRTP